MNKSNCLISVCIVTYNNSKTISKCLKSIIKSFEKVKYEILLYDNLSNDKTLDVIKKFPVQLFTASRNKGFANRVNFLVSRSKGEVVLILNPDLYISSKFNFSANDINNILKKYDVWTYCDFSNILNPNNLNVKFFPGLKKIFLKMRNQNFSQALHYIDGSFLFVNRKVFNKINGFRSFFLYGEDIFFSKDIIDNGYKSGVIKKNIFEHNRGYSSKKVKHKFLLSKIYPELLYISKHKSIITQLFYLLFRFSITLLILIRDLIFDKLIFKDFFNLIFELLIMMLKSLFFKKNFKVDKYYFNE